MKGKKVGIITYHHYYNYGTVLQAYALQKAIDGIEGYDSEIIDYRVSEEKKLSKWQLILLRIKRLPVYVLEWKRVRALKKYAGVFSAKKLKFDQFFKEDLIQNDKTFLSYEELNHANLNYDVLVTGSDQTWSPKIGFFPAYFLDFGSKKALRIAYAPSIGVAELSDEESNFLNLHLQPYEAISCREKLGTEILNNVVKGKKIVNVLDPTFLLKKDDWNKMAVTPNIKGDYILCYFIGHKTYYRDIAMQLSSDLGIPLYFIPVSWQDVGKGYNLVEDAGPREFLGLIRDARLVLTDSFHGTALSINYKKSFYSFTKIEGGKRASDNSRLYDILSKFHLEDRLYDQPGTIHFSDIDYTEADKALVAEREKSMSYLKDALIDSRICAREECTGCMACQSVCAHEAIKVEKDLMGFYYPRKNMDYCIQCGLCEKVCPNNTKPEYKQPSSSYVATAVDYNEQNTSTSGGVASVITRYIISQGGVVYGCTSIDAQHIQHIRICTNGEVNILKGSKYVQSDMTGVMSSIKKDLMNNNKVLFIGTPCQVAGLKNYLRKPYENLLTIDFVCHGVPSQQLLDDIIESSGITHLKDRKIKIDFRYKDATGHSHYGIRLTDKEGIYVHQEDYPQSHYIAGFLSGMYYRDSCYQCHYAKSNRVSDITLGDFWDREHKLSSLQHKGDGISMILVNSYKGSKIIREIDESVKIEPVSIELLLSCNAQLKTPMQKNAYYSLFKTEYISHGYNSDTKLILEKECRRIKRSRRQTYYLELMKKNMLGRTIVSLAKNILK